MSSKQEHLLSNVVELDEHTGSSYDGQLSSQTQRASNAEKALQIAWHSQVTFVHGSISLGQKKKRKEEKRKERKVICLSITILPHNFQGQPLVFCGI